MSNSVTLVSCWYSGYSERANFVQRPLSEAPCQGLVTDMPGTCHGHVTDISRGVSVLQCHPPAFPFFFSTHEARDFFPSLLGDAVSQTIKTRTPIHELEYAALTVERKHKHLMVAKVVKIITSDHSLPKRPWTSIVYLCRAAHKHEWSIS